MVDARPLDGDDHIANEVTFDGLADFGDRWFEALLGVFDHGGWDEDAPVKIGEHPFGAGLGTVDGHDAEVIRPDLLDSGVERSRRLGDAKIAPRLPGGLRGVRGASRGQVRFPAFATSPV